MNSKYTCFLILEKRMRYSENENKSGKEIELANGKDG